VACSLGTSVVAGMLILLLTSMWRIRSGDD
jgi:hypothetical protein